MIYGYCRISTPKQNIDRQVRNIIEYCTANNLSDVKIKKEVYTGTKFVGRKEFENILKNVKSGDTIVFDGVSRMSRSAEEGFKTYKNLYEKGVNLVFLKESYIDTESYNNALKGIVTVQSNTGDNATDELINGVMNAIHKFIMNKVEQDIFKAFEQSEKEVQDLHQRTKEGIETARRNGKQIGQQKGRKLHVKKADEAKKIITKYNKDFGGVLNDKECIKLASISRNSFYKYKSELINDMTKQE